MLWFSSWVKKSSKLFRYVEWPSVVTPPVSSEFINEIIPVSNCCHQVALSISLTREENWFSFLNRPIFFESLLWAEKRLFWRWRKSCFPGDDYAMRERDGEIGRYTVWSLFCSLTRIRGLGLNWFLFNAGTCDCECFAVWDDLIKMTATTGYSQLPSSCSYCQPGIVRVPNVVERSPYCCSRISSSVFNNHFMSFTKAFRIWDFMCRKKTTKQTTTQNNMTRQKHDWGLFPQHYGNWPVDKAVLCWFKSKVLLIAIWNNCFKSHRT